MKNNKKINIALTGGATGGHIFPLLSTYNYLKEDSKYSFLWVGEENSLEEEIANKNKIIFLGISAGKIRRYFDIRNFYQPLKNLTGILFGIYYILKYKIDIIFSKGGYVSLPLCIAAFILRKKIYIHESDTISGISNIIIGKIANKIFYTFPNKKINEKKHFLVGQILNPELLDNITELHVNQNKELNILIIAGSQGSSSIFNSLLKIIPDLKEVNFTIILGKKNLGFKKDFKNFPNITIYGFITQGELGDILKNTDISITRAGATTLWELNMFGVHSIIVPLKNSAGNHQLKNAKYFHEIFGNDIINDNQNLHTEIFSLINKYKNLRKKGLNLDGFYLPLKKIKKYICEE